MNISPQFKDESKNPHNIYASKISTEKDQLYEVERPLLLSSTAGRWIVNVWRMA
ncbi:two component LuxR family transcriptional regulator [Brucella melitensis]|nr:two component LuxR family transcriptional regulator [Brucella melitensis]